MLPSGYMAVHQATTREAFRVEVVRFAQDLGFSTVSAVTLVDRELGRTDVMVVDNTPGSYVEPYSAEAAVCRRDPVLQHCKRNSVPIIWNQKTYVESGAGDLWEAQASHGYRTGIALALHLPGGKHFVLGVDRDDDLPSDAQVLQRMVADLQLFAVHAQDAALRVMLPELAQALDEVDPRLTPRELEVLRWTMDGKTAWEAGAIMGISERTAVLHVQNAMRKLNCINKHQAVIKALKLRLIQ